MGRGRLADLHGLMTFLQLQPWGERAWWSHAIEAPLTGTSGGGGRASERDRAEAECRLLSLLHALSKLRRMLIGREETREGRER